MRTVLVGAVEASQCALNSLVSYGYPPVAVVTLPPEKRERHSDYVDLHPVARQHSIPIVETDDVNAHAVVKRIRSLEPDYVFVIGWSQICRADFLKSARHGIIGFHPSALPVNRGRGVIPWTIIQRRGETGSTLFWLAEGMDDGDLLAQRSFSLATDETATSLCHKHLMALDEMLTTVLPLLESGQAAREPQDHTKATYCARRRPADGLIEWQLPAHDAWTLIRAVTRPYPGAFTFYKDRKLIIWSADLIVDGKHWGLPGQIVSIDANGVSVQCGDRSYLLLREFEWADGTRCMPKELRLHDRLGISWLDLYLHSRDRAPS